MKPAGPDRRARGSLGKLEGPGAVEVLGPRLGGGKGILAPRLPRALPCCLDKDVERAVRDAFAGKVPGGALDGSQGRRRPSGTLVPYDVIGAPMIS